MILSTILILHGMSIIAADEKEFLSKTDMEFLTSLARAVLDESRVRAGAKAGDAGPNVTGNTLIRPGGRHDYPAFWIRDYAMSLDMGMITLEEQRHALFLTAKHQPDTEIALPTGSVLPPGSIPDHIGFGDVPIFFPGILDDYEKQGGPRWGKLPCLDDAFFFIHMAAIYARQVSSTDFLKEVVNGKPLLQRLEEAYSMPPAHPDTGIVYTTEESRGVNFGFFDTVINTGDLLFASVLKYQASIELAELLDKANQSEKARQYREKAKSLKSVIPATFSSPSGFLKAATGISAQPDVWGTAYAVYVSALPSDVEKSACEALARALKEGTIAWRGQIRHVPTNAHFSTESPWEKCYAAKNTYQNGAYWDTPTGWVCYAVAKVDFPLAQAIAKDYLAELREGDFRKGPDYGSPWECMHHDNNHRQNPVYLASVSGPLAAFQRIHAEHRGK
ncbi:MAG TPA: hypothetical protein PLI09_16165 [Candidatus Hydrogenedentes bacterium]|nr:hypothetical protein [Candidatus Hydrogenedentota bacterium]